MYDEAHAWRLVTEHTQSESLRNHMRAVSIAMRAYARKFGGDESLWAAVGLLHDFDYEENPDVSVEGHPLVGTRLARLQPVKDYWFDWKKYHPDTAVYLLGER